MADAPPELTNSFGAIRANALEALTELRRVLGVLRDDRVEDRAPQPTLNRLGDLADNGRAGGLVVTTRVTGAVRPLPPGVELSAYRIVQEALSNAMRHAPGSQVQVDLRYEADAVAIHVANGPPQTAPADAPAAASGGHGVLGMRERASMLGADLVAGPGADGGYAVTAVLPTSGSPAP